MGDKTLPSLWYPQLRDDDPDHGMPAAVADNCAARISQGRGACNGAPAERSTLTHWRGLDGAFTSPPLRTAIVRTAPHRASGAVEAVTGDVLSKLLAACESNSPRQGGDAPTLASHSSRRYEDFLR